MELHAMEYIQMELATSPEAISWVDQFTTKRRVRSLGDRRWSTGKNPEFTGSLKSLFLMFAGIDI